jgi:hypothetical protein
MITTSQEEEGRSTPKLRIFVGAERMRLGMGAEEYRIVKTNDVKRPWSFTLQDADGQVVYFSPSFRTREQAKMMAQTMVDWDCPVP